MHNISMLKNKTKPNERTEPMDRKTVDTIPMSAESLEKIKNRRVRALMTRSWNSGYQVRFTYSDGSTFSASLPSEERRERMIASEAAKEDVVEVAVSK